MSYYQLKCKVIICLQQIHYPLTVQRNLLYSIITNYSMKYQKSSYSLHNKGFLPFSEQKANIATSTNWKPLPNRLSTASKDFSSVYNARGRLNHFRQQLLELHSQIQESNQVNKDTRLEITFMREEYSFRKMGQLEVQLTNSIKQLRKRVIIGKRSDLLKYEAIQHIMGGLAKNHKQLRGKVEEIEKRVKEIQDIMGTNSPSPYLY